MQIDIVAIGSEGDVRPHVALGVGLQAAGHRVRLVTLNGFEALVQGHGLAHLSIAGSPHEIASTAAGRDWVDRRASTLGFVRGFVQVARSLIQQGLANYWAASKHPELLIVNGMGLAYGVHVAERLGIPAIRTHAAPSIATRYDWSGRQTPWTAVRGDARAMAGAAFRLAIWSLLRGTTNTARREILDLPPLPLQDPFGEMERRRIPALDAYSSVVVARPPDWGSWIHVTGYWFLDDEPQWLPPRELVDFLASGPPPVFVGFGSTPFPNPEQATELVTGALTGAGTRGIVVAGGSGLATGRLTDDILSVPAVPHRWLFPQVRAAVHHGGAGVTGAALRAGLPSVVVPVFGDQPFWAGRVLALGAGPRPIPAKKLTREALSGAIAATADREMQRRAAAIGERIRMENGVARAVEAIHGHLGAMPQVRRAS